MFLENHFFLESPIDEVWDLFDDVSIIIPCLPGASFVRKDGDVFIANIKTKIGLIRTSFDTRFRLVERDFEKKFVRLEGGGIDDAGKGGASGILNIGLLEVNKSETQIKIGTELKLTGRIAQFGASVIPDIAADMVDQFASNLEQQLNQAGLEIGGSMSRVSGLSNRDRKPAEHKIALSRLVKKALFKTKK